MKNKEERYILLELVEEISMSKADTEAVVIDYTDCIDIELADIRIERFVGTRFFRAPASLFFTDEALREMEVE